MHFKMYKTNVVRFRLSVSHFVLIGCWWYDLMLLFVVFVLLPTICGRGLVQYTESTEVNIFLSFSLFTEQKASGIFLLWGSALWDYKHTLDTSCFHDTSCSPHKEGLHFRYWRKVVHVGSKSSCPINNWDTKTLFAKFKSRTVYFKPISQ